MCEHICPTGFKFIFMWIEVNEARYFNPLEFTFFPEDSEKFHGIGSSFSIPVEIYDVVKVTRSRPLSQRAKFLGEGFNIIVGENLNAISWCIGVRVKDWNAYWWQHYAFVGSKVELDPGQAAYS